MLFAALPVEAAQSHTPTLILVDKKTNTLQVAEYAPDQYKILKTYHTTVGKVIGDKETEGDLKTPEGIYVFGAKRTPPELKPKFGKMAFHITYPNAFDCIAGRTGSAVMLHATDEPERLKKDFDSEGCVVVNNGDIEEIQSSIRLGLTPILIFAELTPDYMKPNGNPKLQVFFEKWVKAWENKDTSTYIESYHSDFSAQGMNKTKWKAFKGNLNTKYKTIQIGPENVLYFRHPKYSMITFVQNYHSTLRNGKKGHVSRGTKILYVAEEDGQPKIIAETYTSLMW